MGFVQPSDTEQSAVAMRAYKMEVEFKSMVRTSSKHSISSTGSSCIPALLSLSLSPNLHRCSANPCTQVRSVHDLLSLTREMKEIWLFGHLDTLLESEAEKKTDEHARAVAAMAKRLLDMNDERMSSPSVVGGRSGGDAGDAEA